jgi:hypothetical protein
MKEERDNDWYRLRILGEFPPGLSMKIKDTAGINFIKPEFNYVLYNKDGKRVLDIKSAFIITGVVQGVSVSVLKVKGAFLGGFISTFIGEPRLNGVVYLRIEQKENISVGKYFIEYRANCTHAGNDFLYLSDLELYRERLYNMRKILL